MLRTWIDWINRQAAYRPIDPDAPFSVIGDIHGRADLLARALQSLAGRQVVCVGDYVDRGPDSAQVLRQLHERDDIVCLSGNHEELFLEFFDAPEEKGRRWLRFGGSQTLASFGITGLNEASEESAIVGARDQLCAVMEPPLLDWLRSMPLYWRSGNIAVMHAGADPDLPIDDQGEQTLHWGHPKFGKKRRADGIWVVHGHTIVDEPQKKAGRIAIDTGAFFTGQLTIAHIERNGVTFETVW